MSDNDYPPLSAKNATLPTISRNGGLPHPLDTEWHVSIDETVYGPFSGHDMKTMAAEGRLEFDTLVQKVGEPDKWMQAAEDRTLSKFFTPDPKPHSRKASAFSAGDGAQVVTVNNNVGAQPAYFGERPVDKSPFLAAILSLFIVGVGQMYNGEVGKGILMFIGCILLWALLLGWIINIWAIIDAYGVANRKHDAYQRWMEANAAAARAQAYS
jgi:TM2 domain-containing membrane protein YozV